jgi:hypothetical protein
MGYQDFNFDLAADESWVPHPDQVAALTRLLPAEPFGFAPPVTDRAAWDPWRDTGFGRRVLARARELAAQPWPELTDEVHVHAFEKEDVTRVNAAWPVVRARQTAFLLAELIHDEGEFLGVIEADSRRLAALRTWIHPGNDRDLRNYKRETFEPDLCVCHASSSFAHAAHLLGARLPAEFTALLRAEVELRLLAPLRERLHSGKDLYWWLAVTHNWNAVCLACYAHTAATLPDARERAWWLAVVMAQVRHFRDSFGPDGFCTEGVSYWSYGFSHFVLIAELLRQATGGAIDLADDPTLRRAGRFPDHVEIQPGLFPTFADCVLNPEPWAWLRLWPDNRRETPVHPGPVEPADAEAAFNSLQLGFPEDSLLWMFRTRDPHYPVRLAVPPAARDWFASASLLICRPAPSSPRRLSATLLGGHNGVNHNHNDLGTYTLVLDGRMMIVDPGLETYSFRTFSARRYESQLLNSYGHPVPRVAGRLQSAGADFRAVVLRREADETTDHVVLDLARAYEVPTLRRLERDFLFDRAGDGSLVITDTVAYAAPEDFETALISLVEPEIDGTTIRFTDGPVTLVATAACEGCELVIEKTQLDQPVGSAVGQTKVNTLHPWRVAVRCAHPVETANIRLTFRPA